MLQKISVTYHIVDAGKVRPKPGRSLTFNKEIP
ncbi:protein of unknown function [Burkholderia multivorans]